MSVDSSPRRFPFLFFFPKTDLGRGKTVFGDWIQYIDQNDLDWIEPPEPGDLVEC